MYMTLVLKVEVLAGSDLTAVAYDMCALSRQLGVLAEANFNAITLLARPTDNPLHLVDAYHDAIKNGRPIASAMMLDVMKQ